MSGMPKFLYTTIFLNIILLLFIFAIMFATPPGNLTKPLFILLIHIFGALMMANYAFLRDWKMVLRLNETPPDPRKYFREKFRKGIYVMFVVSFLLGIKFYLYN